MIERTGDRHAAPVPRRRCEQDSGVSSAESAPAESGPLDPMRLRRRARADERAAEARRADAVRRP